MQGHIHGNEDKGRDLKGISEAQTRFGDMSNDQERQIYSLQIK